ncbi:MAG: hypothetical protein SF187_21405 [Deltaproteobacteria bacterium]|nr:hypothetical protein [Deltaproteobacteria bacterium]
MAVTGKAVFVLFWLAFCACGDPLAEKGYAGTPKFLGAGVMSSFARPVRQGERLRLSLAWAHRASAAAALSTSAVRPLHQALPIVATAFPAEFTFSIVQDDLIPPERLCPPPVAHRLLASDKTTDAEMMARLKGELHFVALHAFVDPALAYTRLQSAWSQLVLLPQLVPPPVSDETFAPLVSCYLEAASTASAEAGWPACFDVADILLEGESMPNQGALPWPQLPGLPSRYFQNLLATGGNLVVLAAAPSLKAALSTPRCAKGIINPAAIRQPYHLARVRCDPQSPLGFGFEIVDEATTQIDLTSDLGTMSGATPCERDDVFDLRVLRPLAAPATPVASTSSLRTIIAAAVQEARAAHPDAKLGRVTVTGLNNQGLVALDPLNAPARNVTFLFVSTPLSRMITVSYNAAHAISGSPFVLSQFAGIRTDLIVDHIGVFSDEMIAMIPEGSAFAASLAASGCSPTGAETEELQMIVTDGVLRFGFGRQGVGLQRFGLITNTGLKWQSVGPACPSSP